MCQITMHNCITCIISLKPSKQRFEIGTIIVLILQDKITSTDIKLAMSHASK